jgi:hypothetical protein
MPNMVMGWVEDLLVVVHSRSTPSDEEWTAYLDVCVEQRRRGRAGERPRQLVITEGGAPNLKQRRWAHERAPDAEIPVAVITTSGFARFVVNWLISSRTNAGIRAFSVEDTHAAYAFLEVGDREAVERCVTALQAKLTRGKASGLRPAARWWAGQARAK